jgi:peroxiredoxin Q/BCP
MRRTAPALLLAALFGLMGAGPARALEVGQPAPDFTLAAPGGKQVTLADLTGKGPVVIYTFIQAFTGP